MKKIDKETEVKLRQLVNSKDEVNHTLACQMMLGLGLNEKESAVTFIKFLEFPFEKQTRSVLVSPHESINFGSFKYEIGVGNIISIVFAHSSVYPNSILVELQFEIKDDTNFKYSLYWWKDDTYHNFKELYDKKIKKKLTRKLWKM